MAQTNYRLFSPDKTGRKHLQIKSDPSQNNWIDLQCPFTAPVAVPVQNSLGHQDIRIIGRSCGNDCPLFNILHNNLIQLHCASRETTICPDKEQPTDQNLSSTLIHLK